MYSIVYSVQEHLYITTVKVLLIDHNNGPNIQNQNSAVLKQKLLEKWKKTLNEMKKSKKKPDGPLVFHCICILIFEYNHVHILHFILILWLPIAEWHIIFFTMYMNNELRWKGSMQIRI